MNYPLTTPEPSEALRFLHSELDRCKEYIKSALEHTGGDGRVTHTFSDIVEGVENQKFQFWPGKESCMVTEVIYYPNRKGVHVFLAGGDLDEIMVMEQSLSTWAKAIGADHLSLAGRRGWQKVLKNAGWGHPMTVLTKEI